MQDKAPLRPGSYPCLHQNAFCWQTSNLLHRVLPVQKRCFAPFSRQPQKPVLNQDLRFVPFIRRHLRGNTVISAVFRMIQYHTDIHIWKRLSLHIGPACEHGAAILPRHRRFPAEPLRRRAWIIRRVHRPHRRQRMVQRQTKARHARQHQNSQCQNHTRACGYKAVGARRRRTACFLLRVPVHRDTPFFTVWMRPSSRAAALFPAAEQIFEEIHRAAIAVGLIVFQLVHTLPARGPAVKHKPPLPRARQLVRHLVPGVGDIAF